MVALCFVAVLAIAVTSFITMSTESMRVSDRSLQTVMSEQLAEMGLEQAIAAMNSNSWTTWTSNGATASWTFSGSTANGTITFPGTKYGSLGVTGSVNIRITNYNIAINALMWNGGTNYAAGDTVSYGGSWYTCIAANTNQVPTLVAYWTALTPPMVHAQGIATPVTGAPIKTQLAATLTCAPLFPNAIAAATAVTVSAGGTFDSYDSSQGTYGQTTTPFSSSSPNIGYSAVIAGGNTGGTAVSLTNGGTISGYVSAPSSSTSPYSPQFTYSANAIVKGTSATPSPKVDVSRVSRSPYIPQYSIQTISGGSLLSLTQGSNTTIGTAGARTPTVYYTSGSLNFTNSATKLTIVGPVVISVAGDISLGASGVYGSKIIITSTGSAVINFSGELFVGDTVSGGGIDNTQTKIPQNLILIGTSTYNSGSYHYYWSSIPFYGVIYMPNAYVTVWSGVTVYGAISAQNVAFPYSAAVHYDVALRKTSIAGMDTPYIISKWREVTSSSDPDWVSF